MPKTKVNHENTIIYKIEHFVNKELVYVGSTTNFTKRKNAHKTCYNNINSKSYNLKVYKIIRENGGWDSFQMLEIKKYPCKDKREAEAEEERCRVELRANMNTYKAFCPKDQYYIDHRNKIFEYNKQYYVDHREEIFKIRKKHFTCDCGGRYTHTNKAMHLKSRKHLYFIDTSPPSSDSTPLIL
jgi:hypothetical protein